MSSVIDQYNQLRQEMNEYRLNLPDKIRTILMLRNDIIRKASNEVSKMLIDITYNIVDVANNPIIMPNTSAPSTHQPYIQYTGAVSVLQPPFSYAPPEGIPVIQPPIFLFDVDKFISSAKQMSATSILSLVYGIAKKEAPYECDFENAVKKVCYTKNIEMEYEALKEFTEPEEHGYSGKIWFKMMHDTTEFIARIDVFRYGTKTYLIKLADSNAYVRYTKGTFAVRRMDTNEFILLELRGSIIHGIPDEYTTLYYEKHQLADIYGILIIDTPNGLYRIPAVVKPENTPVSEIESLLAPYLSILTLKVTKEGRPEYGIAGEIEASGIPQLRLHWG